MEERFVYNVVPRRPIRNLIKGKIVSRSENLSLTKEEVLYCLKFGAVYRKFYGETRMEKVVPSNLDRLHRKQHLTQKEYDSLSATGHYVVSGFFDTKGSETTDSTDKKKHLEPEDPFLSHGDQEEESISSEPDDNGSDEESSDDNIEKVSVGIINTTSFPRYFLDLDEVTEEIENISPITTSTVAFAELDIVNDTEEAIEDEEDTDDSAEDVEDEVVTVENSSDNNRQIQNDNRSGKKKGKRNKR